MKNFRLLIPLGVFLSIGLLLWKGLSLKPAELPSVLIGRSAPSFQLTTVENPNQWRTEQTFKGQVTILNVWSTDCRSCQVEHAFWLSLKTLKKENSFVVIGLNYHDEFQESEQWLKTYGNPYDFTLFDKAGRLAMDFGVYGTPETFIVDKEGIIRYRQVGAVDEKLWQNTLLPIVEKLQ